MLKVFLSLIILFIVNVFKVNSVYYLEVSFMKSKFVILKYSDLRF